MATALEIVRKFYPDVESVTDAKRGVTIEVTKRDTQTKAVKNHKECAMAVACKRQLKADAAIICVKTTYIINGVKATRYMNPESVAREITSFDRNAGFVPGSYALCKVSPANKLGTRRKPKAHTGNGNKAHYHRTEDIRVIE